MEKILTKELIDQIVFAMENQEQDFFLDLQTMEVLSENDLVEDYDLDELDDMGNLDDQEGDASPRFLPLPSWQSVDGFNLMERFVHNLHNPLARNELQRILTSGRGVFRQFKDILRQYPEVAKRWYRYKDRAMQETVIQWFTDTMETWGLTYTEPDFDDTDDLIMDDFQAFRGTAGDIQRTLADRAIELDLENLYFTNLRELFPDPLESHFWTLRKNRTTPRDTDILTALATPAGDLVGIAWIQVNTFSPKSEQGIEPQPKAENQWGTCVLLYVLPEYRGLGCAKTLVNLMGQEITRHGLDRVFWDIPASASFLLPLVEDGGFKPISTLTMGSSTGFNQS